ncbi:MAG: polysaccharide deacetylase family protein [Planctomycetota bacterium]
MSTAADPAPASSSSPAPGESAAPALALKIDIDTDRGCQAGLPTLLRLLDRHQVRATFFLTLGPDNMGRAIWRVFTEPGFLKTVQRRGGASTYGWSILFKGFLWPGPVLWKKHRDLFRSIAAAGHEVGVHAWDHHHWQRHAPELDATQVRAVWARMVEAFEALFGRAPTCAAAPGWRCAAPMLALADEHRLAFVSDVRGQAPFRPRMGTVSYATPELPTTLPTLDELIGRGDLAREQLNERLFGELKPGGFNCHTIHAEIEGLDGAGLFDGFLAGVRSRGYTVGPLGPVAAGLDRASLPVHGVVDATLEGRSAPVSTESL